MSEATSAAEATESNRPGAAGLVSGLFRSLSELFATFVAIAQTRMELLTTELQEEVHHAVGVAAWALVAMLATMIGLFFAGFTIILVYWNTHPIAASLVVMGAFLLFAAVAVAVMIAKLNARPRFLDATLTELSKDASSLKSSIEARR